MSVSQVRGQTTFGYLFDRKPPLNILTTSSTMVAGIAAYSFWGLTHSLPLLAVLAVIYGSFGAGYTALLSFGLLNFGRGVGNVLAGPIGGALLEQSVVVVDYRAGKYEKVVLFVGPAMVLSAGIVAIQDLQCAKPVRLLRR
ncbi:uncharacterized protein A1O5_01684 [Cladophialophora psammophila CBS 110553]|uniref:Uncharacterized protein n=1 Tax=Cladophialophora psammophila CBS 110553 TaxID=1182543 RepID=W9X476_9EURO|nr:uncharacterized protein A1O5_01684 [Cladophialophora psammophila CBS 110553]EXJ74988.1 hypothetical protein A1O5_01684 [Cladophialophora psammophila CBS 110553]